MNIQLTISMLVSDRIDTLGRCLESITPLLKELNSELIIVYTGQNPDTLKLAEKYTSHIIPFSWCSDFSRARNAGLKEAKGEWFLYLDDDEWFEDVEDILRFFKSGEYKDYQSALYVQRNYNDWAGTSYVDANVGRMCRLTPETEFIYPIHENLFPFAEPYRQLNSYVHHFGYIRNEQALSTDPKFQRNLTLLLKSYSKEATSHLCTQIAQEYKSVDDYSNAIRYCREGLKLAQKEQRIHTYELWLQVQLPNLLILSGDREAALKEGERLLNKPRTLEVGRAHLSGILAGLCWELGEYPKGVRYARRYHKEMENLRRHPDTAKRQNGITITYESAKERAVTAYMAGLLCASKAQEVSAIGELLSWMPWDKEEQMLTQYENLESWKEGFPEQWDDILGGYARLRTCSPYVTLQKALHMERKGMAAETEKYFNQCMERCPEGFEYQLVKLAARNRFSLKPLLAQMPSELWDECIEVLTAQTEVSDMGEFLQGLEEGMREFPVYVERLAQSFLKTEMKQESSGASQLLALSRQYCESIITEAGYIYKEEILKDLDFYALPYKYKFAGAMQTAIGCFEAGKYADCISYLEKAAHTAPDMAPVIGALLEYIKEEVNRPKEPVSEESEILGRQVKQVLMGLMENGQWEEAFGVVNQLMALLPGDPEILKMKQEIIAHRL